MVKRPLPLGLDVYSEEKIITDLKLGASNIKFHLSPHASFNSNSQIQN
jgi:lactate dehydrogenase-like 2-hydroxyacid dehydrogenase